MQAYGGQQVDMTVIVDLVLIFTDGDSKHLTVNLHHNGLVTIPNLRNVWKSLHHILLYPNIYYNDCKLSNRIIHHCIFNCIKKILIHNK